MSADTQAGTNGSVTDKQTGLMWQQCSVGTDAALCSGTTDYSRWLTYPY